MRQGQRCWVRELWHRCKLTHASLTSRPTQSDTCLDLRHRQTHFLHRGQTDTLTLVPIFCQAQLLTSPSSCQTLASLRSQLLSDPGSCQPQLLSDLSACQPRAPVSPRSCQPQLLSDLSACQPRTPVSPRSLYVCSTYVLTYRQLPGGLVQFLHTYP